MLTPAFALAITLATLWGAAFHFALGGGMGRMARFLLTGWLGFALGQFVGQTLGNPHWTIGSIQVFPASLGAIALLFHTALRTGSARSRVR